MPFNPTSIKYLLTDHGKVMTLIKRSVEPEYDIDTGTAGYQPTYYLVQGYAADALPTGLTGNSLVVSSANITVYSKQTNGQDLPAPQTNDQIISDGKTYNVEKVMDCKSRNKTICYTLICRG